jgi:ABC-2 type transport system permease protein
VTSNEPEALPGASDSRDILAVPARFLRSIRRLISKTSLIVELELRKVHHDPVDLFTRAVQPVLWLLIVAPVFNNLGRQAPTGYQDYRQFMAPGKVG